MLETEPAPRGINITPVPSVDPCSTTWDDNDPDVYIRGKWDLPSVTSQGGDQISAVHEMGHVIGLPALMGLGIELRVMYFLSWAVKLEERFPSQAPFIPVGPHR